jgi:hypothetical protein
MENQDAYHNQCNVNTACEPGLNEQDDREGERGEQLLSLIGQDSLPPRGTPEPQVGEDVGDDDLRVIRAKKPCSSVRW